MARNSRCSSPLIAALCVACGETHVGDSAPSNQAAHTTGPDNYVVEPSDRAQHDPPALQGTGDDRKPGSPGAIASDSPRDEYPQVHDRTPNPLPDGAWPPAGESPTLVYDSRRKRSVLLTGRITPVQMSFAGLRFSVWEWDGTTWTDRAPAKDAQWPTLRSMVEATFDSDRGVVVMFGGVYLGGFLDETWEWNGATFTQLRPALSPPARNLHAMAYDPVHKVTWMFGGQQMDDLWQWDGVNWTNRTPTPRPAAWPSPREGSSLVWDSARERVILFGGQFTAEVWEWDGTTWVAITPTPLPDARIFQRQGHVAVFDEERDVMLVFGGLIKDRRFPEVYGEGRDLWEWSSVERRFRDLTPDKPSTAWPLVSHAPAGAFDSARKRLLVFGGQFGVIDVSRELHEFEL